MKNSSLELLEKARLPTDQARAILQAMDEEAAARYGQLATKEDLQALELATKNDLRALESATKDDFRALESAMKNDFRTFESAMKDTLDLKIDALRSELRAEIKGESSNIIRWSFAFWVTNLAALVAILKLVR